MTGGQGRPRDGRAAAVVAEDRPARSAALAAVELALDRLEEIIAHEIDGLHNNRPIDFVEVNRLKSRSLLQLTKIVRSLPAAAVDYDLAQRTARLRASLEQNQELLRVHLTAAEEIASILTEVMREAESDGTYGAAGVQP